jgi:fatty-acyl-CoA synthase
MALIERFEGRSVASALSHRATTDPERTFLLHGESRLTFGEVDGQAEALAAGLNALGIGAGDRIALILPPCPEFVIALLAAAKLGAAIVPLDPGLATSDLQYMLRHSEASAAVATERYGGVEFLELFDELLPQLPDLQTLVTVGGAEIWYDDQIFPWADLTSSGTGRDFVAPEVDPATTSLALFYTSGTTGKPKAVSLSHANLLYAAAGTADALGLGVEDRVAGISALFNVFGVGPGILGCLLAGSSLVLTDPVDAGRLLDAVETYRVTVQYGIPTLFRAQLRAQEARPRDLSSLRVGLIAGAPAPPELVARVQAELCPVALVGYSITETASTICVGRVEDPPETRRTTVGRPLDGSEYRIVEDGVSLPVESVGEIRFRGPGIMLGYHRQPRRTAEAFDEEGFLKTGDLAMVDDDGFIHLVGRHKDVIIRSGFNVYPREVEDRILSHPAIIGVAVVGTEDEILGEAICACVLPVEGALVSGEEIRDWCRTTLSDHKVPDLVRFFDEFPRTRDGKVRRVELARLVRQEPGRTA